MELLRKAENLTEAYVVLDPAHPLEGEWLECFYTERPEEASITYLIDELLTDPGDDDKTLLTGHRGSGKTTELARLEKTLQDTHTIVRFDIEGRLNLGDADYADLLVVMGLEVFKKARAVGVKLDEQKLHDLLFWYTTRVFEESERSKLESELSGELDALFARFNVRLTSDAPYRREIVRAQAQAHLSDLLGRLNVLLDDLQARSGRRTLVIVDGLDKMHDLNQVRDFFFHGFGALAQTCCRVIYTVPLSLYHTDDFQNVRRSFARHFILPNVKTVKQDGTPYREGQEALLQVLDRRLMPGLLTPETAGRLVDLCGGLLKELITLARDAVLRARRLRGEQGPVEPEDVEYVARHMRNTYRSSLTQEQYRTLWRIYQGKHFTNNETARSLLHNLSLLEYDGGDTWWGINPIVRPLLEERADEFRLQSPISNL